ncbi:MAG: LTA synthase family protein [Clostridiales bacterium]|nr:LTA synthase family protein [Clostridiales bacterium]
MKKIRSCFLFQRVSDRHKTLFWLWNWFFVIAAGAGAGILSLLLAFGHYRWEIFYGYFRHPLILILNLLPVILLMVLLYCLIGRAWIAFLGTSVPLLLASAGNYFKLLCRDDPFLFADVTAIGTALKVSGNYDISLDSRLLFCILCVAAGTLFLAFFVRGHIRARSRLIGAAAVLISIWPLSKIYLSENIYVNKTRNYEYANQWSATQVYITRGFVYPFLHSIPDAFPEKPDGYSTAAAQEILSAYEYENIPKDKKVNVISIQLEAFSDLERIGFTGISEEVYAQYHALEAESYTGNLLTNVFAGGTIDTERGFITGYYTQDNYRKDAGSYIRYFNEQGYFTEGSHSCYDWFYNRKNINTYLGFDRYWFLENRYGEMAGGIAADDILIPDILALYQARDKSVPYFSFSVTYQGHGPYSTDSLTRGDGHWNGEYEDEATYYILNNYLASVKNTSENLVLLTDALRFDAEPVVLLLYGDHKPWLGYSNSVYGEQNINLDTATQEGFYNYFGTRYMIWANEAAKEALGNDFSGEGPDISPCFLMNLLFEQCGWGGGSEYMQLTSDVMAETTVAHVYGYFLEDGKLTSAPSERISSAMSKLKIAQYYRKTHPEW